MTHELQTTELETKAPIMGQFRSTVITGVIMAKPQEKKVSVVCPAMVRHDCKSDGIGSVWLFL
jgi:hypothetical protein